MNIYMKHTETDHTVKLVKYHISSVGDSRDLLNLAVSTICRLAIPSWKLKRVTKAATDQFTTVTSQERGLRRNCECKTIGRRA